MTEGDFFFRIKQHYFGRLPFVVHNSASPPGVVEALLQTTEELYHVKDYSESGFVFAPFDDEEQPVLIPEQISERISLNHLELPGSGSEKKPAEGHSHEVGKDQHVRLVEKVLEVLRTGELKKVVLSRREEIELEEIDPIALYQDLLKSYPGAYVYCWYHPAVGLWLGATPETLLKVHGTIFETMALAGTRKFEGDLDVNWGEKEKQEQRYVTDSIVENLQNCGITSLTTSDTYTVRAGNLLHLKTDIRGTLQSQNRVDTLQDVSSSSSKKEPKNDNRANSNPKNSLEKIILALHPTPAVCGLPKEKARRFILKEEGYNREYYTGFLGELNKSQVTQRSRNRRNVENLAYRAVKKETSLFVNLRCMKIEGHKAVLFIGGGITKDSVPEDEWQETVNKSQTMKKVLFK